MAGTRTKGIFGGGDPPATPPVRQIYVQPHAAAPPPAPPPAPGGPRTQGIFETPPTTTTQSAADPVSTAEDSQGDGTWSSLLHDTLHPQAANMSRPQTWRDWATKSYHPAAADVGRAALDDVSFGFADPIRAGLTGENVDDLRKRSADAQAAMGPAGVVMNAATYAVPGMGEGKILAAAPGRVLGALAKKAAPKVGRYVAAGGEGAVVNALSTVGHEVADKNGPNWTGVDPYDVMTNAGAGALFGVGGQAIGDAIAAGGRPAVDWVNRNVFRDGNVGRGGEDWNGLDWRNRAKTDPAGVQAEIRNTINMNPQAPRAAALADLHDSMNQTTEPGATAQAMKGAAALGSGWLGYHGTPDWMNFIVPTAAGGTVAAGAGNAIARGVNRVDRNINVGHAFDRNYSQITGNPASTIG